MRRLALVLALAMSGCATAPTGGSDAVQLTSNQQAASGCRLIGQETVRAHSMPIDITTQNAITAMRNKAVEKGATLIVSPGPQVTMPGPVATMTGDLYAC